MKNITIRNKEELELLGKISNETESIIINNIDNLGNIPQEVKKAKNLKSLYINNCDLVEIDLKNITRSVKVLDFSMNKIENIKNFKGFELYTLNLGKNNIGDKVFRNIVLNNNITYIDLMFNNIEKIVNVFLSPFIKSINVGYNKLDFKNIDFSKIHNDIISNYEEVIFQGNTIYDKSQLNNLKKLLYHLDNLYKLDISNMDIDQRIDINNLKKLKYLDISYNEISNVFDISNLNNLIYLNISNNKISNIPNDYLKGKDRLKVFSGYQLNLSNVKFLEYINKDIDVIDISGNNIKEIDVLFHTSPELLDIAYNPISEFPKIKLRRLVELDISNTNIKKLPKNLYKAPLQKLNIGNTKISKLDFLNDKFKYLNVLMLYGTNINDLSNIYNIKSLNKLVLGNTNIKRLPKEIKFIKNITIDKNIKYDKRVFKSNNIEVID